MTTKPEPGIDLQATNAGLFGSRAEEITRAFTRRAVSLFQADCETYAAALRERIENRRILVAGGAGSIGTATIRHLLPFSPAAICVIDPNENNLAELVRDIRSSPEEFRGLLQVEPLDYGSRLTRGFLERQAPFDFVLSFAALKHVRSERDEFSCLRMLEVNLVCADRFLSALRTNGHGCSGVFFVSTDKAARPVNLMGASKRAMEALLFAHAVHGAPASFIDGGHAPHLHRVTSTRFANVAFSDGSLPWGFLERLRKGQALAVPENIRRFFVSPSESGQLCLLAAFICPDHHLLIPDLDQARDLIPLTEVASATLASVGLSPVWYRDTARAKRAAQAGALNGGYPVLLTNGDTSGEKESEEFTAHGEHVARIGLQSALVVEGRPGGADSLRQLLRVIDDGASQGIIPGKDKIVRALTEVVPEFEHRETGKVLDSGM